MKHPLLLLSLAIYLALGSVAHAQTSTYKERSLVSHSEDVALMFYKLSGNPPDFVRWAKETDAYKSKPVTTAQDYVDGEVQRLQGKWNKISPKEDILTLETKATLQIESLTNQKDLYRLLLFNGDESQIFFPYEHSGHVFSLVPSDTKLIENIVIDRATADKFIKIGGKKLDRIFRVRFVFKPEKAYADHPMKYNKAEFWAMTGNIVAVDIYPKRTEEVLWHAQKDDYVTPQTQKLIDMYDQTKMTTP